MHVSEIVFFRAIVQIIIAAAFLAYQRQSPWGNNPKLLIMRGFFGSMGLLVLFLFAASYAPFQRIGNSLFIAHFNHVVGPLDGRRTGAKKAMVVFCP